MASSATSLRSIVDRDDFVGPLSYATSSLASSIRWPKLQPQNRTKNPLSFLRRCHGSKLRHPSLSSQLDEIQSLPEDDVGRLRDYATAKDDPGRIGLRRRLKLAATSRGGRLFRRRRGRRHSMKQSRSPPLSGYLELEPSHTSSLLSISSSEEEDSDGSSEVDKSGLTTNALDSIVASDPSQVTLPDADLLFADFGLMENNLEVISEEPAAAVATAWSDLSQEWSTWPDESPSEYLQLVISYRDQGQDPEYAGSSEDGSGPTLSVSVATFQVVAELDESSSLKSEQQEDLQISDATPLGFLQDEIFADTIVEHVEVSLSEQEPKSPTTLRGSWSAPPPPFLIETVPVLDESSFSEPDGFHPDEPPSLSRSPGPLLSVETVIADTEELGDLLSAPSTSVNLTPLPDIVARTSKAPMSHQEVTAPSSDGQPPIQQNATEITAATLDRETYHDCPEL